MRYPSSVISAIIISFFTFLGMSILVTSPKHIKTVQTPEINFTLVNHTESQKIKTLDSKKKPPPKQKSESRPSRPKISVFEDISRESIRNSALHTEKTDLSKLDMDIPKHSFFGAQEGSLEGEMRTVFRFLPTYPNDAARNKIEGWVKIEFTVNEFGKVSQARIIDSKPKRVFEAATLRSLYKSKFKPKIINGKAVSQTAIQTIEFKLE